MLNCRVSRVRIGTLSQRVRTPDNLYHNTMFWRTLLTSTTNKLLLLYIKMWSVSLCVLVWGDIQIKFINVGIWALQNLLFWLCYRYHVQVKSHSQFPLVGLKIHTLWNRLTEWSQVTYGIGKTQPPIPYRNDPSCHKLYLFQHETSEEYHPSALLEFHKASVTHKL
jgi:hypothetical protein